MLTIGSLFSGIGGFERGFELASKDHFKVLWQIENDPFCNSILNKNFPNTKKYSDIKEVNTNELERVDIICGGPSCQPYSCAGKRQGKEDNRHLWPEFIRIIRDLKPSWVVGENVRGLLSIDKGRIFGGILADLADIGYDAEWQVLSANALGAPHKRERVWIVAYPNGERLEGSEQERRKIGELRVFSIANRTCDASSTSSNLCGADGVRPERNGSIPNPDLSRTLRLEENQPLFGNGREASILRSELQRQSEAADVGGNDSGRNNKIVAHPDEQGLQGWVFGSERASEQLAWARRDAIKSCWPTESRLGRVIDGLSVGMDEIIRSVDPSVCAKQTVIAVIVKDGKYWVGSNWCNKPQEICPRLEMKTGEGYELCHSVCEQYSHAEIDTLNRAGSEANGADLYLFGHTYCCEDCLTKMELMGIKNIYVIPKIPTTAAWEGNIPRTTFEKKNRPKRLKALGNAVVPQCVAFIAKRILTLEGLE